MKFKIFLFLHIYLLLCTFSSASNKKTIRMYQFSNQTGNSIYNDIALRVSYELQENLALRDIKVKLVDSVYNSNSINKLNFKNIIIYGFVREATNSKIYFEINCIDKNGKLILSKSLYSGINAGQKLKLIVLDLVKTLQKLKLHRISINTKIPGFLIYANRQFLGETPLVSLLKPGYYKIIANKHGYSEFKKSIRLNKDTLIYISPKIQLTQIYTKPYPTKKFAIASAVSLATFFVANMFLANNNSILLDMNKVLIANPIKFDSNKYSKIEQLSNNYKYFRNVSAGFVVSCLLGTTFCFYHNF